MLMVIGFLVGIWVNWRDRRREEREQQRTPDAWTNPEPGP